MRDWQLRTFTQIDVNDLCVMYDGKCEWRYYDSYQAEQFWLDHAWKNKWSSFNLFSSQQILQIIVYLLLTVWWRLKRLLSQLQQRCCAFQFCLNIILYHVQTNITQLSDDFGRAGITEIISLVVDSSA